MHRIQRDRFKGNEVEAICRNQVSWKTVANVLSSGAQPRAGRIEHRLQGGGGEVSRSFRYGRHGRDVGFSHADSRALVADEEKRAVAEDGSAGGGPKLVAPKSRLGLAHTEKVCRIQLVVAQKLIGRAVQGIRPGLRRNNHRAAHAESVLCRIVVSDYLEFLNGIDGRRDSLRLIAQLASRKARIVIGAIEEDVGLQTVLSERAESSFRVRAAS